MSFEAMEKELCTTQKSSGFGFCQCLFVKKKFGSLPTILAANSSHSS